MTAGWLLNDAGSRCMAWARIVLLRLSAGWTLWPLLLLLPLTYFQALFYLIGYLGQRPPQLIVDGRLGTFFLVLTFLALAAAWVAIAVQHVRVAVDAWQLRVPGFPRTWLLGVCSLAAWTVLAMSALLLVWPGTTARWAELIACVIAMGCLAALIDSPRWLVVFLLLMALLSFRPVLPLAATNRVNALVTPSCTRSPGSRRPACC